MAKRLSDETLRMDIVLNGDEAQEKLGALQKAQRDLKQENEEIRKQKTKLVAAGKKETQEYKNLADQLTKNNRELKENRKDQAALRKEMGLAALTTRQLAQEEKRLKAIMGGFSPDTKEWHQYNEELLKVKTRQKEVRDQMRGTSSAMGEQKKTIAGNVKEWLSMALGIGAAFEAGRRILSFGKEWIAEARKIAEESKGVEFAFKNIGQEAEIAFAKVKKSTRGTLSDLDIKKAIVEFDNFGLSQKRMGDLFEFLTITSSQTGKSIDYLRDSLVEGLSKESKLRIDNLGISAAALNAELEKTPDFVEAVANIAATKIKSAGNILDEAANSSARWDATLQNLQLRFGKMIDGSGILQNLQRAGTAFFDMITPTENASEALKNQTETVIQLQNELDPLIKEYDDLKSRTNLTADEQDRLKTVIQAISKITPGAVTEFDAYGNALSISADKARDFIKTQQAMLKFRNQEALKEQTKELERYQRVVESTRKELEKRNAAGEIVISESTSVGTGGVSRTTRKATDEEIAEIQNRLAKYQELLSGAESSIEQLSGDYLSKYIQRQKQQTQTALEEARKRADALGVEYNDDATAGQIEAAIKQWESLSEERKKQAEERIKEAQAETKRRLKAIADLEDQYLKEREDRQADTLTKQAELEKQRALKKAEELKVGQDLIDQITTEHDIKIAEAKKADEQKELDRILEFEQRKRELMNEIALANAKTEEERDLLKQEQKNEQDQLRLEQELERLALNEEQKTELLTLLRQQQNAAIDEIETHWRDKKIKDEEDLLAKRKALMQQGLDAAIQAAGQETKVGQGLLIIKQLYALKEQAIALGLFKTKAALNTAEATTDIAKGTAKTAASAPFPANIPLIIGFVATVAGLIGTIKNATKKGESAARVKGFEDGLYPLTRTDGKTFNVRYGGRTKTGIVRQPTHFSDYMVAEKGPEMVIDNSTFKKLDPQVINHILDVRGGRTRGYETGYMPRRSSAPVDNTNNENAQILNAGIIRLNAVLTILEGRLSEPLKAQTIIGYEEQRKINDLGNDRTRSSQNGTIAE